MDGRSPSVLVRMYFVEDLLSASIMASIAGAYPGGNCVSVSVPMVVFSVVHLLYVGLVRPYRGKLDTLFSIAFSLNQTALAIVGCATTAGSAVATPILSPLIMFQVALFFVQAVVQASHEFWRMHRKLYYRRVGQAEDELSSGMLHPDKAKSDSSKDGSREEQGDTAGKVILAVPLRSSDDAEEMKTISNPLHHSAL